MNDEANHIQEQIVYIYGRFLVQSGRLADDFLTYDTPGMNRSVQRQNKQVGVTIGGVSVKRVFFIFLCSILMMLCVGGLADVEINETHFPDPNFRKTVTAYDKDRDGMLSKAEIAAVDYLRVPRSEITSLKGIEFFTAMTQLDCGQNKIRTLDLSKNARLKYLWCDTNQLTSLNLNGNPELITLGCWSNQLKKLNLEKNTKLVNLDCYRNKLSSLDLTKNTNLRCINCSGNNLKTLDVSQCKYICELLRRKQPGVSEKLGGYGWWDFTADGNGDCLFLDQTVKVITDKEEKGKTLITRITLDVSQITLKKGKSYTIKVKEILPAGAAKQKVRWSSSNKKVATVSSKGKVKAKGKGSCIITCSAADGSKVKASCKVTVK